MSLPIVAVVGRPNVGKSTFFNRVLGRRLAIVDDRPGVTRDRNFARAEWAGREFYIVDTGGMVEGSDVPLDRAIRAQALAAIEQADVVLLLVDAREGVHPLDEMVAHILRKSGKPIVLVANKLDNLPRDEARHEFWSLGLGDPAPVSAISGKGSGDVLDRVLGLMPPEEGGGANENEIRVAVVGKPNVGKSSFVNRLLGEERVVVSEVAGTTRDSVDTPFAYHGKTLVFVDTAGLRRQSKVKDSIEYYSALRTDRAVQDSDVCIVMVDGTETKLHAQDVRIAETAWDAGKAVILVVNKWDLVTKETMTAPDWEKSMRERIPFLKWVPMLFTSALTGQRVRKCLDLVLEVQEERLRRIETHEVNEVLEGLIRHQPPGVSRGRRVKVRYSTQIGVRPPTFAVFVNFPKALADHYIRFLHNGFREAWTFMGTPIRLRVRSGTDT
ncbi:MAG: ribosome biogenesis GTPase Der [Gemmatimonadetes bacterium]|nr:ribosome biogenesis GTPase Der [Gemmatimonadota bacterium]